MNEEESAVIKVWGDQYFPHLIPPYRYMATIAVLTNFLKQAT